jgi:hypothetical protein
MRPLAIRCWEAEEMPVFDSILSRSISKYVSTNGAHYSVHIPSSPRYKAELHGILRFMARMTRLRKVDEVDNSSGGMRMRWTMVVVHWPPLLATIKFEGNGSYSPNVTPGHQYSITKRQYQHNLLSDPWSAILFIPP